MAMQPISASGIATAKSGYVAAGPLRALTSAVETVLAKSFVVGTTARTISPTETAASHSSFTSGANERFMSQGVATISAGSLVSFLNLRLLSTPFGSYSPTSILRESPLRRVSPGYEVLVPKPFVPETPPDTTAPSVGNFTPVSGSAISRTTSITFDVTDDSGQFRRIFVVASFAATGACEVIHDGDGFRGFYAASSSRKLIAHGFRYTVARTGGWPAAPAIQAFAMDASGNEAN